MAEKILINYQLVDSVKAHDEELSAVKFSKSGEWLASASWESAINLWAINDGHFTLETVLTGHKRGVSDIAFSSDDCHLASASDDKNVKVWDIETAQCITTFKGHRHYVFCLVFKGNLIFSGSDDKTAKVWDRRVKKCIRNIQYHSDRVTSVDFRKRNNNLLTSSLDHTFALHDFRTSKVLEYYVDSDAISHAKFTGRGKHIAVSTFDSVIKLWDIDRKKVVKKYEGHLNSKYSVFSHVSHGGNLFASGSEDKSVYIWYPRTGEIAQVLEDHEDVVISVQFHPRDERILVSGSLDKNMRLWKNHFEDD